MKVRIVNSGEVVNVTPASLDGKFAVKTRDGRLLHWEEVEFFSDSTPTAESVALTVNAITVSPNISVFGGVVVSSRGEE